MQLFESRQTHYLYIYELLFASNFNTYKMISTTKIFNLKKVIIKILFTNITFLSKEFGNL